MKFPYTENMYIHLPQYWLHWLISNTPGLNLGFSAYKAPPPKAQSCPILCDSTVKLCALGFTLRKVCTLAGVPKLTGVDAPLQPLLPDSARLHLGEHVHETTRDILRCPWEHTAMPQTVVRAVVLKCFSESGALNAKGCGYNCDLASVPPAMAACRTLDAHRP